MLVAHAMAQGVLAPPPVDFSGTVEGARVAGTNVPGTLMTLAPPLTSTAEQPLLKWGSVEIHPRLFYQFLYGDGIPAAPGQSYTTAINTVSPGVFLQLGNHWTLDYTALLRFYSSSQFRNTFDNAVTLTGGTIYEDWTFGLSSTYASSSQPLIETGTQTDTETSSTRLGAVYKMSRVLSLDLAVNQNLNYVGQVSTTGQLSSSATWSTTDWLDYQIAPTFSAGVGLGFGYTAVSVGANMTYEQLHGRVNWNPGSKFTLTLSGGIENRQFLDSSLPNSINPIMALSAHYQVFEATTLTLAANQAISPSLYANQVSESTTIDVGLRQRFFKKLYLDVMGGYFDSSYSSTAAGVVVNRDDNGVFVNVRLTATFLKRGTASLVYQYLENNSNQRAFGLSSTQVGFELGYRL
jgi:hypothetical protein